MGPQGEQGVPGEKGTDGTNVLTGHGEPSTDLGKDGEELNVQNNNYHFRLI